MNPFKRKPPPEPSPLLEPPSRIDTPRTRILGRVHEAVRVLRQPTQLPTWEKDLVKVQNAQGGTSDLWTLFAARLKAVNGTPLNSLEELAALLKARGWLRGYCDPLLMPDIAAAFPPEIKVETVFDRTRVDDYAFGITRAAGAIAETGTVILTDSSTSSRLGALAPWLHAAVFRRREIYPDITSAVSAFPPDPNIVWVTGPSKTADVEGILIEGVHGPGIQVALIVE